MCIKVAGIHKTILFWIKVYLSTLAFYLSLRYLFFLFRSICSVNLWNKNEQQSAKDNNHLSKPNCRLSYPGYSVTDGKWEKYSKWLTLNWDFPREEEYLIEINGVSNGPTLGSFPELERRNGGGDKMISARGERGRTVQGRIRIFYVLADILLLNHFELENIYIKVERVVQLLI